MQLQSEILNAKKLKSNGAKITGNKIEIKPNTLHIRFKTKNTESLKDTWYDKHSAKEKTSGPDDKKTSFILFTYLCNGQQSQIVWLIFLDQ